MKIFLKNLIYFTLFLTPLYFFRFTLLVPTNIFEVFVGLSFLLTLFGTKKLSLSRGWILPGILLVLVFLYAIFSPDKSTALGIFKGWFLVPLVFAWTICQNFEKKDLPKLAMPIFISLIAVSIWAILQKVGLISTLFYQVGDSSFNPYLEQGRVFGPFGSPNYLAMFLVSMIFLSLPIFFLVKNKIWKILTGITFILPLLALILTQSRAGLIAFGLALLFVFLLSFKKIFKNKLVLGTIVVVMILVAIPAISFFSNHSGSDDTRKEIYHYSFDMVKSHWFAGVGLGNFQNEIDRLSKDNPAFQTWGVPFALHPHNLYLAFWLNLGLIGLIFFLAIVFQVGKNLVKSKDKPAIFYAAALLAILIHGLFDTTYFKNDLAAIFCLVFAFSILIDENTKVHSTK